MTYRDPAPVSMNESDANDLVASLDNRGLVNLRRAVEQRIDRERRSLELTEEEHEMLRNKRKIDAVMSVRYRLNLDLRTAKDFVDRWSGAK